MGLTQPTAPVFAQPPWVVLFTENCATSGDPTHCGGRTQALCLSLPFLDTRPSCHSVDTSHLTLTLRQVFPSQVTHLSER